MQLFSLKPLRSGTESHSWKWLFTELADGLWRVSSQSSSALEYVPPSPMWFVCNDAWHGGAASDARDLGPCVIRNAWRRSLLIRAHSCSKSAKKKKKTMRNYFRIYFSNLKFGIYLPRAVRTNLRVHVQHAIERVLLVRERDLLRCTNDDSTIRLSPHRLISPAKTKWQVLLNYNRFTPSHPVTTWGSPHKIAHSHNKHTQNNGNDEYSTFGATAQNMAIKISGS